MRKHYFDDEWKQWIWSNIKDGSSKQEICDILMKEDYDIFTIMNELRFIPALFRKKDEIPFHLVIEQLINAGAHQTDDRMPLFIVEKFLDTATCESLIAAQRQENVVSTTGEGKYLKTDETRKSHTTYFELLEAEQENNLIHQVKEKISLLMGIPEQYSEAIQGQWYQPGGFYHNHFDADDDYNQAHNPQGNRTWTCMINLNNVEEGGYTYFPELDLGIAPKAGQAIIWYNLDERGLAHPLTLHTGQAVIQGEKFIITQWFHQCAID